MTSTNDTSTKEMSPAAKRIAELRAQKAALQAPATAPTPAPAPVPVPVPQEPIRVTVQHKDILAVLAARKAEKLARGGVPLIQPAPSTPKVQAPSAPAKVVGIKEATATLSAHEAKMAELKARLNAMRQQAKNAPLVTAKLELPASVAQSLAPQVLEGELEPATYSKHQIGLHNLLPEQLTAVELARQGKPFVLIGSAGSGKTTTVRVIAQTLAELDRISKIRPGNATKHLQEGLPAMVVVSFTNQAVTNIKQAMPAEFQPHCLTKHKVLEFAPVYFEVWDSTNEEYRKTMRYEPQRTADNPIPQLELTVIEEAGSVGLDLYDMFKAATPTCEVEILLGDLNQLPPVFGDAILGYKLLEYPVVELKHIHRQGTDSAIKKLAYKILEGVPVGDKELKSFEVPGELELSRYTQLAEPEVVLETTGIQFQRMVRAHFEAVWDRRIPENVLRTFDYENDVVLCPYGKGFGSIELAKYIAQTVSECLQSPTYEIIAGFTKHYYAVGDIVYWNRNKWRIVDIIANSDYVGTRAQPASTSLTRWGVNMDHQQSAELIAAQKIKDMESLFDALSNVSTSSEDPGTAFHQASHTVVLEDMAGELDNAAISKTGEISDMYLAYAITVHKSQGSEWNKVFCVFHASHSTMIQRELLYTAVTRARKHMRIFYSGENPAKRNDSVFQKGILSQKIPGNTLKEKLKYFENKLIAQAMTAETAKASREGRPPRVAEVLNKSTQQLASEMLDVLRNKRKLFIEQE